MRWHISAPKAFAMLAKKLDTYAKHLSGFVLYSPPPYLGDVEEATSTQQQLPDFLMPAQLYRQAHFCSQSYLSSPARQNLCCLLAGSLPELHIGVTSSQPQSLHSTADRSGLSSQPARASKRFLFSLLHGMGFAIHPL